MSRRFSSACLLLPLACLAAACSSGSGSASGGTASGGTSSGGSSGAAGEGGAAGSATVECRTRHATCELTECDPPLELGLHEVACAPLTFNSNPPTSGTHYGVWAAFQIYDRPVPRGFLLHSLEHSGVVLSYNCAAAKAAGVECDALVAELTEFFDAWPADPLCTATRHRLIVVPDPELDAVFAASAWGHYVKGDCFDADAVSDFIEAYYGKNYENLCNPPANDGYLDTCGE